MADPATEQMAYWAAEEARRVEYERGRPAVIWRPRLFIDGDQWCALYGENIQDGVCGFGPSPDSATRAFDEAWQRKLTSDPQPAAP